MNNSDDIKLRELLWRRDLTPAEEVQLQSFLAAYPEQRADWEAEASLNLLLDEGRNVPVPSNFTSRVMENIELELAREERQRQSHGSLLHRLRRFLPRIAAGTAALLVVGLAIFSYQRNQEAQIQEGVALLLQAMPEEPAVFKDFDAIQRLDQVPANVDEELWVALSQ